MTKILVTGAGGTVGSALVNELEQRGVKARLGIRDASKRERALAAGRDAVALDYADVATLGPALEGVDRVFLLGAGGRGQTEGEIAVVDAAKAAGVRAIVKLSVWEAAGEAYSFAKIHRPIERAIEASGIAYTFLRPNGFMQNFVNHMGHSIRSGGAIHLPMGETAISHVDVRDIARVAAEVLSSDTHRGRAYELSGPAALSYGEAAAILSRVLERPLAYVTITDDAARAGMLAAGMPEFYADYVLDLNRHYRNGGAGVVTSAVRDVTGRDPISFETFARDHAASFR
jgi:uncharacterized protein YbjT (DUF2867 family)